jgi:hypothetical protein
MSFPSPAVFGKILAFAGVAAGLAACGSGGQAYTAPAAGAPVYSTTYSLQSAITFAHWPPAAGSTPATSSFDISATDPVLNVDYIADRNNAGVTVLSTASQTYLRTAGAGKFAGYQPNGPGNAPATNAGPNGLVNIGNGSGIVFAGDGDSTLKVVNTNTGALLQTQGPTVNPYTGIALPATCGGAGTPTTGAGNQRLDEMAYDPTDGIVLAINDAACPPFGTFFSTTAPYAAIGNGIAFTTANGGAEQPLWDPGQNLFIQPLPTSIANPNGELDLINPHTQAIVKIIPEPSNCEANGQALGQNETLFLACSATGELLTLNAVTGAVINTIVGYGGCDEAWYNPSSNRFYAGCSNNVPGPVAIVADGSGKLIQAIPTSTGAHSIAVDQVSDHIFLPTQKLGVQVYIH